MVGGGGGARSRVVVVSEGAGGDVREKSPLRKDTVNFVEVVQRARRATTPCVQQYRDRVQRNLIRVS